MLTYKIIHINTYNKYRCILIYGSFYCFEVNILLYEDNNLNESLFFSAHGKSIRLKSEQSNILMVIGEIGSF